MRQRDDSQGLRWAVFCVVLGVHGVLALLALNWVVRVRARSEQPLVFLVLPDRAQAPLPAAPPHVSPPKKSAARPDSRPVTPPAAAPPEMSERPRAPVDWQAEADLSVKRQEELAQASQPRALDQHGQGIDLNGGVGPDHKRKSDFAWDRKHTNRVEILPGVTLVHLSDHCVLVFFPFPMAFCGIGKIPVHGDLFDHMRDEQQAQGNPRNIVP
jgi:hypothetical protein